MIVSLSRLQSSGVMWALFVRVQTLTPLLRKTACACGWESHIVSQALIHQSTDLTATTYRLNGHQFPAPFLPSTPLTLLSFLHSDPPCVGLAVASHPSRCHGLVPFLRIRKKSQRPCSPRLHRLPSHHTYWRPNPAILAYLHQPVSLFTHSL